MVYLFIYLFEKDMTKDAWLYFQVKLQLFIFVSKILVIHGVNLWRELLFLIKHFGIHLISLIISTENRFSFQCD